MRIAKVISAKESVEILNKPWLTTNDIRKVASTSTNKAITIRKKIAEQLEQEKYFVPAGLVPTKKVIDYLKINVGYLRGIVREEER